MFRRVRPAAEAARFACRRLLAIVAVVAIVATVAASRRVRRRASRQPPPTFATACGTKPVTMQGYFETGFPDIIDLTKEFTRQHPTSKWHIRQDQFAVITQNAPLTLSGPNPPDLMRLPQVSGLIHDHLLKNLDGYFKQYGWNQLPGLAARVASDAAPTGRPRGTAPLWAMGVNYSLTGVFYNKTLAAKIGMTSAADRRSPNSTRCSPRRRPRASRRSPSSTAARPAACSSRCSS